MKKAKIVAMAMLFGLLLTVCGCGKKVTYTVTFDSNGGSAVETQTIEKDKTASKPIDPTKEGYEFEGWYINLDDDDAYDFSKAVTADITLKAKWSTGAAKTCDKKCDSGYTLSDDCECVKNSETVSVKGIKLNVATAKVTVGKTVTIKATVNPSNATKKNVTWKSSDTSIATVKNGVITGVKTGSATITATVGGKSATVKVTVEAAASSENETVTYTVKFDSDGGSEVASQTVESGKTASKPSDPTKTNYNFAGWTLDESAYDFSSKITKDITLKATWTAKTVTYSAYWEIIPNDYTGRKNFVIKSSNGEYVGGKVTWHYKNDTDSFTDQVKSTGKYMNPSNVVVTGCTGPNGETCTLSL